MNKKLSKEKSARTTDDSSTKDEEMHVSPAIAKPIVCVQVSCLCDESRSLDGRSRATFTIKPVVCCVALRGKVVNDATGESVRVDSTEKRL